MSSIENQGIEFFLIRGNSVRVNKERMDSLKAEEVSHLSEIEREFFAAYKERGSHFSLSATVIGNKDQEAICRALIGIVKYRPQVKASPL